MIGYCEFDGWTIKELPNQIRLVLVIVKIREAVQRNYFRVQERNVVCVVTHPKNVFCFCVFSIIFQYIFTAFWGIAYQMFLSHCSAFIPLRNTRWQRWSKRFARSCNFTMRTLKLRYVNIRFLLKRLRLGSASATYTSWTCTVTPTTVSFIPVFCCCLFLLQSISPGMVDTEFLNAFNSAAYSSLPKLQANDVTAALVYALGTPENVQVRRRGFTHYLLLITRYIFLIRWMK